MTLLSRFLLSAIVLLSTVNALGVESEGAQGAWAREATSVVDLVGRMGIRSPDARKVAFIEEDGGGLSVVKDGRRLLGIENRGVALPLAELSWASASTAFFITYSRGGEVGEWRVDVYVIEKESVRWSDVTQEAVKRFKKHYKCYEPEDPNVGAATWVNDSKRLLLITEVPPHSSCPEMGKIRGYLVEVPSGKIIREYAERDLRARWG